MDDLESLRQEKERLRLKREITALKRNYDTIVFVVFFIMFFLGLAMTGSVQLGKEASWFSIGKLIAGPLWCMPFLIKLLKR